MGTMPCMFDSKTPSRPTVLMLTTDRQIDRRTLQQADSLEKVGWSVIILAMPTGCSASMDDPRVIRLRLERPFIPFFSPRWVYQKLRSTFPMNAWFLQVIRRRLWAYVVHLETLYHPFFAPALSQYTPDVVMAIDLPMLPIAASHARACRAKLVYDSHELYSEQEFSARERLIWTAIEAKFIHQCDAVITVNPSIARALAHRYDIQRVHVLYNAMDAPCARQQGPLLHQSLRLSKDRKILLFQGGLSSGRHLDVLVRAMKRIKHEHVDLVFLGDGPLKVLLTRLVQSLALENRVYFHPAVPQAKLLAYTQSADAGIIPYQATCLNNYYCTPNKLFEFIAAGLPILGSDLPELHQIILNHDLGLIGNMGSVPLLAQWIDALFQDEGRLVTWRKNSVMAQAHFAWRHEEKKLHHIFEGFIA